MWASLNEMQSYNGRSKIECIMLAMGNAAETKEAETGRMSHRIKSLAKLKRNTESMGL
jgi:hypothetical protein